MNTEEIATRLVTLVNEGKNVQAEQELYADTVVSYEQDGRTVKGKAEVIAKTTAAFDYFEEKYSSKVAKHFINQDTFLLQFEMDFKPKGGERMQLTEYGLYKVAEGKVIEEYFYA